jgi:hypothetical protein
MFFAVNCLKRIALRFDAEKVTMRDAAGTIPPGSGFQDGTSLPHP